MDYLGYMIIGIAGVIGFWVILFKYIDSLWS